MNKRITHHALIEAKDMNLHIGALATDNRQLTTDNKQSLRRVCQEFESIFIAYLFKSMRRTVPKTEFGDSNASVGFGKDVYLSMMDEELAHTIAKGPGIGLAATLYRQFSESKKF